MTFKWSNPKIRRTEEIKTFPLLRALWFVLEIIMAKNENNSHAFIRKMVENIKQTKDAQNPTDSKTNEVHFPHPWNK